MNLPVAKTEEIKFDKIGVFKKLNFVHFARMTHTEYKKTYAHSDNSRYKNDNGYIAKFPDGSFKWFPIEAFEANYVMIDNDSYELIKDDTLEDILSELIESGSSTHPNSDETADPI